MRKKAQEEMVGFVVIIIIVAVILLFLLSFSLKKDLKESVENPEVDSFIQASLQYTTDCRDNLGYFDVEDLISECSHGSVCLDERQVCGVLESVFDELIEESWKIGQDRPLKGYWLQILVDEEEILVITEGNTTNNREGAVQELPDGFVSLRIYY